MTKRVASHSKTVPKQVKYWVKSSMSGISSGGGYFLDVSSPGAERPIKDDDDLEMTLNQGIYVKTYQQIDGNKEWTGILKDYDSDTVTIDYREKTRTKTVTIGRDRIATIRKAVIL